MKNQLMTNQELIDICFSLIMTAKHHEEWFKKATRDELTEWVQNQLYQCGYPTIPMGMSHGILVEKETYKKWQEKNLQKNKSEN